MKRCEEDIVVAVGKLAVVVLAVVIMAGSLTGCALADGAGSRGRVVLASVCEAILMTGASAPLKETVSETIEIQSEPLQDAQYRHGQVDTRAMRTGSARRYDAGTDVVTPAACALKYPGYAPGANPPRYVVRPVPHHY